MLAQHLVLLSAAIVFAMGTAHLLLTFFSGAFNPRDAALHQQMQSVPVYFSRRLLMGPAWIGFNASHSMGPMIFGLLYGYLALEQGAVLLQSPFLLAVGVGTLALYIFVAARYWFYLPLLGILAAFACFAAAIALR